MMSRSALFKSRFKLLVCASLVVLFYVTNHWNIPDFRLPDTDSIKRVLIAVPILIDSVERRRAIRESWGNFSSYPSCEIDLTLKFFVGNPRNENEKTILEEEIILFKDMIQLHLDESYFALTTKTIKMFSYIIQMNATGFDFDYVVKTDDDTFVNLPVICHEFNLLPKTQVYGGKCHRASKPYRVDSPVSSPKLVLSREEYPAEVFPPFCEGPFYYLSRDMIVLLMKGFGIAKLIKFEDVSVGIALNSVVKDLSYVVTVKPKRYHYLASYKKSEGLEIAITDRRLFSFKWALHPVVTYSRLKEMQKLSLEINT